jgi:hypothetical protein
MIPAGAQKGRHIDRFTTGLVTNRAATSMPFRRSYGAVIQYYDALIGGLNVELSPQNTLVRRPGWSIFNNVGYSGTPQGFYDASLSGTQYDFLGTTTNVYQFDGSSLNSIYTKGTTAQTFFQQVGNVLYFSDGDANKKAWTETNGGFTVQNNGITAPANAPSIPNLNFYDSVGGAQTTHAWVASYTYAGGAAGPNQYYFLAPTGEVFWAVVPQGATLTSGATAPNWASVFGVFGGQIVDGQMVWFNCGKIGAWAAATAFANAAYVQNAPQNQVANQATVTHGGVSGNFNWQTATATAQGFTNSSPLTGDTNTLFIEGLGFNIPAGASILGISVRAYRGTNRANAVSDVTVKLLKAGVATGNNKAAAGFWPQILWNAYNIPLNGGISITYGGPTDLWGASWTPSDINNATFGVEFIAHQGSTKTTSAGITYQNRPTQPVVVTVYYSAGTSLSGAVYAQVILDSNGNLQRVKTAGTSGGSAPTWSTTIGGTTTDGGITWECIGTGNQLPVLFGWNYAYGFHGSGATNHLSTLSPQLFVNAPIVGTGVQIKGIGSDDTQVDRNDLYRTADGGSLLLYNQSTTNVNSSTTWSITDSTADSGLNFLLLGPIANANDPPPTGMTLIAYYMGRMWGAVGNKLFFSAGPDCVNGDGNQAWPPANVFVFNGPINSLNPTTQGLVVIDSKNLNVIFGGPQTLTFWQATLKSNFGTLSPNCVAQESDEIVMYTTQKQLFAFSPSDKNEVGFNVADLLASTFAASTSYVAIHRNGQDQGLFICDGSANSLRFNMSAEAWDTIATPAMGLGPIASIDLATSPPQRGLVTAVGGNILRRDTTVFTDAGSAYQAYGIIGSIVLSQSLEDPAMVESICLISAAVGAALTVAVLPNEISGSFTALVNPVAEPFQLPASTTLNMQRWDWKSNQSAKPQLVKHVQVKVTMPATDTVKNEIYSLSIK